MTIITENTHSNISAAKPPREIVAEHWHEIIHDFARNTITRLRNINMLCAGTTSRRARKRKISLMAAAKMRPRDDFVSWKAGTYQNVSIDAAWLSVNYLIAAISNKMACHGEASTRNDAVVRPKWAIGEIALNRFWSWHALGHRHALLKHASNKARLSARRRWLTGIMTCRYAYSISRTMP